MRKPFVRTSLTLVVLCAPSVWGQGQRKPAAETPAPVAKVNVTGTWNGNFMGGFDANLFQEGDRVWGKGQHGTGYGFVRGVWSAGRLIMIFTNLEDKPRGACSERYVLTAQSKGIATRLEPRIYDLDRGNNYQGAMTRRSPDPGPAVAYPYNAELENCGQLFTHELGFETASDTLSGTDWPVLASVGEILKKNPAVKIQVVGHTDAVGDAASNQKLSEGRAESVKKLLVERYGGDGSRITTRGWGAEQPLADNKSDEGRAINRRVEIVLVR